MSEEDAELVRTAFEGRLREMADAYWHPQIEYVEDPRLPGAASYRGRDEVLRRWQTYLDVLGEEADIAIEVEDVVDAGDVQVPFVRFTGHAKASGIPFEHLWGYVVEVKDGRITYFRAYYVPEEALEAAGLPPPQE
jgi:ketosteroid isomerase-like protein